MDIGRNCGFRKGWVTLSTNFRGIGGRPPTTVGVRKLESLGYLVALCDPMFSRFDTIQASERHTDRQTHDDG